MVKRLLLLPEWSSKYQIDEVILIGKKQTEPIYDGLKENNYNLNKVHVLNNIMDSFKLIRELKEKDTYVLLQSDLPDLYNENSKEWDICIKLV